jgi:DNA-binding GntR family transcriptional regulator
VALAGNQQLIQIYDGLNLKLQMAMVFYLDTDKRIAQVQHEHGDILNALVARDSGELRQAMRAHVRSAKAAVVERVLAEIDSRQARQQTGRVNG